MSKRVIACGLLFSFAAGIGVYIAVTRDVMAPTNDPLAPVMQAAKEAQYRKERGEEYGRLLARGTKELYEGKDREAAKRTLEHALSIAQDDGERYQAWRWLAEAVRDTEASYLRRAGRQMTSLARTERERAEGLCVTAGAEEKLGAAREAVRLYEEAAAAYQKAGDPAAGCAAFQHAADAALLPGLADIKLSRRLLDAEEKLLERVPEGRERDRMTYDCLLSKADLLRRAGKEDEAQEKFFEAEAVLKDGFRF